MRTLHRLAFLVVALASATCTAEERFFEVPAGQTAEHLLVLGDVQLGKAAGPQSKTIKAWAKQATSARSRQFRMDAAIVLRMLVAPRERSSANDGTGFVAEPKKPIALTDEETDDCRKLAMKLLGSSDKFVAMQGLEMLKKIGDESCCKAVQPLTTDFECGKLACDILGNVGSESSIPSLVRAIEGEKEATLNAIAAIAKIGGPKAKEALEKLYKGPLGREGSGASEAIAKALDEIDAKEEPE